MNSPRYFVIEHDSDVISFAINQLINIKFLKDKCSRIIEISNKNSPLDKNEILDYLDNQNIVAEYRGISTSRNIPLFIIDLTQIKRNLTLSEIFN